MATSQGLPPPGTYYTEFAVDNKWAYLDTGVTMNNGADRKGQAKGKSGKATQKGWTQALWRIQRETQPDNHCNSYLKVGGRDHRVWHKWCQIS